MTFWRKFVGLTALATIALPVTAFVAPVQNSESLVGDDSLPVAEIKNIERGDGYVVVYPESDTPPGNEKADILPTGSLDEDTLVIVANQDGSLPLGLEDPAALIEAREALHERGLTSLADEGALEALEGIGVEVDGTASSQESTDVSPQSYCQAFVAGLGTWSAEHTSGVAVFGHPGYEQPYTFAPSVQPTQELVAGQGVGYRPHQTGGTVREWWGLGSAYTGGQSGGTVSWGNVIGNPAFRAQGVTLGTSGTWCH